METTQQFSYDVHSDEEAAEFFALMQRAGVDSFRIERMIQTRNDYLATERGQ